MEIPSGFVLSALCAYCIVSRDGDRISHVASLCKCIPKLFAMLTNDDMNCCVLAGDDATPPFMLRNSRQSWSFHSIPNNQFINHLFYNRLSASTWRTISSTYSEKIKAKQQTHIHLSSENLAVCVPEVFLSLFLSSVVEFALVGVSNSIWCGTWVFAVFY